LSVVTGIATTYIKTVEIWIPPRRGIVGYNWCCNGLHPFLEEPGNHNMERGWIWWENMGFERLQTFLSPLVVTKPWKCCSNAFWCGKEVIWKPPGFHGNEQ